MVEVTSKEDVMSEDVIGAGRVLSKDLSDIGIKGSRDRVGSRGGCRGHISTEGVKSVGVWKGEFDMDAVSTKIRGNVMFPDRKGVAHPGSVYRERDTAFGDSSGAGGGKVCMCRLGYRHTAEKGIVGRKGHVELFRSSGVGCEVGFLSEKDAGMVHVKKRLQVMAIGSDVLEVEGEEGVRQLVCMG
jgi:hypothetical protein